MKYLVIHGFRVSDGGADTVGRVIEYAQGAGVNAELFSYPYVGLLGLKKATECAVDRLIAQANGEEIGVLGHSHANVIILHGIRKGLKVRHWIGVQPALRKNTVFPASVERVDIIWNSGDKIMLAARMWRKLANKMPWRHDDPHLWGKMGLVGPDSADGERVRAHEINSGYGHSGMFSNVGMLRWMAGLMVRVS
jgi:hypothetical protein